MLERMLTAEPRLSTYAFTNVLMLLAFLEQDKK